MMCKRLWQTQKSQEILKERAAETRVRLDRWSVVIRNGVMLISREVLDMYVRILQQPLVLVSIIKHCLNRRKELGILLGNLNVIFKNG